MKTKFVDCFLLMGTALSLRGDHGAPAMGRPILQDVFATNVNVSITITDICVNNPEKMEVEITFLLHQKWVDPRLGADERTKKLAVNRQIWKPWITTTKGKIINENEFTQFWRGFGPEGNVLYSENVVLKTFCTKNFRRFPFDSQKCFIKLGSYRFPKEEVDLFWSLNPVEILTEEFSNEFQLINFQSYSETDIRPTGNFTVLIVELTLQRFYEHYLLCIFSPCLFITLLSYFTFWLKQKFIKIRYYFSGANLLAIFYFYHISVCSFGRTYYLKAVDIFIIICVVFIIIAFKFTVLIDLCFREENNKILCIKFKYLDRAARISYLVVLLFSFLLYLIVFL